MTTSVHGLIARELRTAATLRSPVEPITDRYPGLVIDDAYAVQRELRAHDVASGARLVGHKIGATSLAIRRMFGVDQPDFGYLTDRMLLPDGAELTPSLLIQPRVEGELAFRLAAPLSGAGVTAADVLAATSHVVPVLEVLDSRIADWRIQVVDTIADNASSAAVVVGPSIPVADVPDLTRERMTLTVDDTSHVATGEAVMGHPAEAVAWLARALWRFGEGLAPGELVLAGAWTAAVPLVPGSAATATFDTLGRVGLCVGAPTSPEPAQSARTTTS